MANARIDFFPAAIDPVQRTATILLPVDATIVHAAIEGATPGVWAMVDPDAAPTELHKLEFARNGESLNGPTRQYKHLGRVVALGSTWQIFERVIG